MKGRLFRVTMLVIVAMLLLASAVPAVGAGTVDETLVIDSKFLPGEDGLVCFHFTDYQGEFTVSNARLAIWDRQDNPSFQTLADWGATLTLDQPVEGSTAVSGTICVPEVLSDHCNRPGPMKIFFKLRVAGNPSRTSAKYIWAATCP